ncbi:MAG: ABC transporter permease [Desulfurococcales archaeon]|nr:ABC transporter permease [Desulfurococcales archaeon]
MLSADRSLVNSEISTKIIQNTNVQLNPVIAMNYLFSTIKVINVTEVEITPLEGRYKVTLELYYPSVVKIANPAEKVAIVVVGNCYGFMGTDNRGRDIAQALLYGFPVALAIGFVTAVASTMIGLFVGAISAYYGGLVDEFLQRVIDVIGNIPLLPFLILLVDITPVEYRLQVIMTVLIVFYWGGLAIVVRSMTLSIKEEAYVEAARAIGASNARILLRHVIPQIVPYAVASLVFSVPGAILAEAGLSVLGLEHGWPTWGKVIAAARISGRYDAWWWVIPPGILLALTSLTFVLLGMAIETIVEPRLRTR